MPKYKYIIWDWNGTILDNLQLNFEVENTLLSRRGRRLIRDIDEYHEKFQFPIIKFYESLDFDLENERFEDIARDYVCEYEQRFHEAEIFEDAERVIRYFRTAGIEQIILSMTENKWLFSQVAFHGIDHLFSDILGTGDIYARSKVDIAKKWMAEKGVSGEEVLFVGDTTHDFEVAQSIGCKCILVARGHNSRTALEKTGARIADSLDGIIKQINY